MLWPDRIIIVPLCTLIFILPFSKAEVAIWILPADQLCDKESGSETREMISNTFVQIESYPV
jgi:hypothetical protein